MNSRSRFATFAAIALGAFAVAGCSSQDSIEAKNESVESVAQKVASSSFKFNPGRWEATVKLEKLDIPGMPPEAKKMMQQHMSATQTSVSCLTPEKAEKPDASFFQPDASGCIYEKFDMADGKLDAVMTCENGGQMQKISLNGTYDEENYNMRMSSEGVGPDGKPVSMDMTVVSRRVGECNGKEEQ